MHSFTRVALTVALSSILLGKHAAVPGCGTHVARTQEELFLHQQASRSGSRLKRAAAARTTNRDIGNIAVIDDSNGVVTRRNPFSLDRHGLSFIATTTAAVRYRLQGGDARFEPYTDATPVQGLEDDDTREVALPFTFPFFGATYKSLWINSNGNVTFTKGDGSTGDYSLGRLVGGSPRIAPLFTDLDPSSVRQGAIRISSDTTHIAITWDRVPLYSDNGNGAEQTFQVRLYATGLVEFAYSGITTDDAIAGISPGSLKGKLTLLSLAAGSSAEFTGPVAEVFAGADSVDIAAAAQKFYATHEDAYDYLVLYNAVGVEAAPNAVAYEVTVRNERTGYGDSPAHIGDEFGSPSRLQSVLNLGPIGQYPINPNVVVDLRAPARDTALTILGHETGHLFLAFASVRDASDADARPMLGRSLVHWAFNFNSEASLLEGNRIRDNGEGANPRFTTIKTVEGYSPLDQYLMGFRPSSEVPPTFVVTNANVDPSRIPQPGVSFNGGRRDITIDELIGIQGRRTPDHTVAQRRFRFAFVLITTSGADPSEADLAQVETYRTAYEQFFANASGNHAIADTTLRRAVHTSLWPAVGVVQGASGTATVTLDTAPATPLTIQISRQYGLAEFPDSITVPAGQTTASFTFKGVAGGVEEVTLKPADAAYETVASRVQVQPLQGALRLELVSGNNVFRVADINELPYPGVAVTANTDRQVSDARGLVTFTLPAGATGTVSIEGVPSSAIQLAGSSGSPITALTNAASYVSGITPNTHSTIWGTGFSKVTEVRVNGVSAPVSFANDTQVNFLAPTQLGGATAGIVVLTPWFVSGEYRAPIVTVSPGIFAAIRRDTALEIYATGLNGTTPTVTVAGLPAQVLYTGQPGYPGLDQINVLIPAGVPSGPQPVVITAGGVRSNAYTLTF